MTLRVCRGYGSCGMEGQIGNLFEDIEKPIHIFFLGDHDPSGRDLEAATSTGGYKRPAEEILSRDALPSSRRILHVSTFLLRRSNLPTLAALASSGDMENMLPRLNSMPCRWRNCVGACVQRLEG